MASVVYVKIVWAERAFYLETNKKWAWIIIWLFKQSKIVCKWNQGVYGEHIHTFHRHLRNRHFGQSPTISSERQTQKVTNSHCETKKHLVWSKAFSFFSLESKKSKVRAWKGKQKPKSGSIWIRFPWTNRLARLLFVRFIIVMFGYSPA